MREVQSHASNTHVVICNITALVTSCDLVGADLVLGQSALTQWGVTLLVRERKAALARGEDLTEVFRQLSVVDLEAGGRASRDSGHGGTGVNRGRVARRRN
ncbi:hypothetical protein Trydic_g8485 [Trypoxylus dichotomus]